MSEESIIAESYSNLKSAILLGRTDIVRGILSTAAESRLENGFFEDEEEEENGEDFRIKKWDEDYEDNPYDILRVMLNYIDTDAGTALHLATKLCNADITRALLSAGADPTRQNKEGVTPFEYCTDEKILKVYNEQLLEAAAHNQLTKLKRLLTAGVSANASDGVASNNRALHWAASFGSHDAVKMLCEHSADPNVANSSGSTPLFDAVKRKHKEIVNILLSYGARTDVTLTAGQFKGKTPLDFTPDGSEIKELLLSPPERVIPEKPSAVLNGSFSESDGLDHDSSSSLSSLGEHKPDIKIVSNENDTKPTRELDLNCLWPYPQQLTLIKGTCYFPEACLNIRILKTGNEDPHDICDMWRAVDDEFKKLNFSVRVLFVSSLTDCSDYSNVLGSITCSISPLLFSRFESYSIHISSHKISLCASELRSLWYSINTLLQLLRLSKGGGIPQMQINDWPDLKYRAFLVDVGHGRCLNAEALLFLVDVLSNLKYNQMVLCVQNSFGFGNHGDVSKTSFPYSQGDIRKLDRYCRKRFIELIPYLDHLSDLSKWLSLEKYKHLGETTTDKSRNQTNSSSRCLSPVNPSTPHFVRDLNTQICSSFPTTSFVHVGISTVDEIGTGASEEECKAKGKGCILVNHLKLVNDNCEKHKKMTLFWANSLHDYIKEGKEMPNCLIAMEYGGKPHYDFGVQCKLYSDSGIPYYVCPGTMSWSSLVGAVHESIFLVDEAIQSAVTYNALGILVTDWSAYGHVTPFEISLSAFAAGAALSWNSKIKQESVTSSLAKVLDLHVFQDEAGVTGQVLKSLSEVHKLLDPRPTTVDDEDQESVYPEYKPENACQILKLLLFPNKVDPTVLGSDNVQRAARCLRKSQASLSKVQMKCRRASVIVKVLNLLIDIALYACRVGRALVLAKNDGNTTSGFTAISSLPNIARTDLANRLLDIIDNYRRVWPLSNKPDGLQESIEVLQTAFKEIVPSSTIDV